MPGHPLGIDVPLEMFGGLVTDMPPSDLPPGVSPDCADVRFIQGGVQTRPGLQSIFAPVAGNPTINYLKTFTTKQVLQRLLVLDALGNLWKETTPATLALAGNVGTFPCWAKSVSLFGREWMAFSDGQYGVDMPRQFDDTNFDRVSQGGAGGGPFGSLQDEPSGISGIAAAPTGAVRASVAATIGADPGGITRASNVVTVTTTAAHGFGTNYSVVIAGVADGSFNGTFTIVSVPSPTTFTYAQTGANGSSGNGTATCNVVTITTLISHNAQVGYIASITEVTDASFNGQFTIGVVGSATTFSYTQAGVAATSGGGRAVTNYVGNIAAGVHFCSVIFKTRQGYLTRPSPPISWTAGGGRRVSMTAIPVGPSNVVARILCFTAAGGSVGGPFFYIGDNALAPSTTMIIPDNTTINATIDFTDTALTTANSVDYLFNLIELSECSGVVEYAGRLFWWGERNKKNNWVNLTFDGGASSAVTPAGWIASGVGGGGIDTASAFWGGAYTITGDGTTAIRGLTSQSAVKDVFGVALISANVDYSVRVRVKRNTTLAQGTLHVHLFGTGVNTAGVQVTAAQATTAWVEFIAQLTAPLATIPSDLVLRVYADGTPTNGGIFYVDNIEIYETLTPYNASLVRASKVENPESYDGVTGFMLVSNNDGQRITSAFRLRDSLYFVKDHSLYVTRDTGNSEPAQWPIDRVSATVGTPSVHGVGIGEDWAAIAHRTGLYMFLGGEPIKISQEIQPLWDTINWQYGHRLWVRVDTKNKRILVGVPIGTATTPNRILMMDYRNLESGGAIESMKSIHYSAYSGKKLTLGQARKWAPWFVTANSAELIERADGTAQMFLGNGSGTGKIYQLNDTYYQDDDFVTGVGSALAIADYYVTHLFLDDQQEMGFQVGSHRKLITFLTMFIEGVGRVNITAHPASLSNSYPLPSLLLENPAFVDLELPINVSGERIAFRITKQANTGNWMKIQKFVPTVERDPWSPVRGFN